MIWLVIALWIISVILIVTDFRKETTRWVSIMAFLCGIGGVSVVWEETIIPIIKNNYIISKAAEDMLYTMVAVFSAVSHYLAPFSMIWYGLIFANFYGKI